MGVWIETLGGVGIAKKAFVTPFVCVWIETHKSVDYTDLWSSHPSWVCGLKLGLGIINLSLINVTPFVGVWIETRIILIASSWAFGVTPFVGVWIETALQTTL